MIMTILRRAALSVLLAGVSTTAYCQDLIARQAPVDRRQRAIDSVAEHRHLFKLDNQPRTPLHRCRRTRQFLH